MDVSNTFYMVTLMDRFSNLRYQKHSLMIRCHKQITDASEFEVCRSIHTQRYLTYDVMRR